MPVLFLGSGASLLDFLGIDQDYFKSPRAIQRIVMAILFLLASTFHFTSTGTEEKLIPDFLPLRREAIYITGVLEIIGAFGLLIPRYRRPAAYGLIALMILVFPANINHSISGIDVGVPLMDNRVARIVRLPLQPLLIWWIFRVSRSPEKVK